MCQIHSCVPKLSIRFLLKLTLNLPKKTQNILTPWFDYISQTLLFPWWNELDTIIANDGIGSDEKYKIHRLGTAVQDYTNQDIQHDKPSAATA